MLGDLWADLRYRVRALFARGAMDAELDAEVRFHLEEEARKLEAAGLDPGEARRRARLAFGGVERVKEESREGRGLFWLDQLSRDVRFAIRGLRRRPGFALGVIGTLGLGIGANAAMFGIVDRLLFRAPASLRDPATVHRVMVTTTEDGRESTDDVGVYTRYLDFRQTLTTISEAAGYTSRRLAIGTGGDTRELPVGMVSASFFPFFEMTPIVGRLFGPAEDSTPVGALVAVISHGYWQLAYGGRADAVGSSLQIGKATYTVIGVTPPGFTGLEARDAPVAWIPITAYAGVFRNGESGYYTRYNWGWMNMIVRRKPEVRLADLDADLTRAAEQSYRKLLEVHPKWTALTVARPRSAGIPVQVGRGPEGSTQARVAVWVAGVAAIVLLIACGNVANLIFGRTLGRRREIAIRLAMGVSRGRLAAELVTECLVLGLVGGVLGLAVGRMGSGLFGGLFLPGAEAPGIGDGRTLGFTLVASIAAGILTGIAPALQAGRRDVARELGSGGRDVERRSRVRAGLLVAQGALSVVLLVGAGLFVRSLSRVERLRLGFDVEGLVLVGREMRSVKLSDSATTQLAMRLREAASQLPQVVTAARALTVPFYDTWSAGLWVEGIDSVRRLGRFTLQGGSQEFFTTAGTRIVRGRGFTADDRAGGRMVAVVSESMGRVLWPGKDAIGQCFRIDADTMPCREVVGIAEDLRQNSVTEPPGHSYYLPIDQYHPEAANLFVRVRGDAARAADEIRRRLQALMPGDSYLVATPATSIVAPHLASWRSGATMFVAFGAVALALAVVGLYSVMAYDVSRRRQELGVRMALGAGAKTLLRLVVREGVGLALLGVAIGVGVALAAGRWIEPLLFQQSAHDPVVFAVVTGVLVAAAATASLLPAIQAARLDPNEALRGE